jgi:molecular chaperone DnaJ
MKNYYFILGVKSGATLKQIREAYRRLAKELHPDYYGDDSGPFIDLQEAYAVLSDPARRRAYDDVRRASNREQSGPDRARAEPLFGSGPAPEPLIPAEEQADLDDLSLTRSFRTFGPSFDELFDRLWRNFTLARPEAEQLRSLNVEIRISPQEALRGGRVRLLVPARLTCPECRGRGGLGFFECWQCGGDGVVQGEYPVTLAFPPGVVNNFVAEIPLDNFGINNFYLRAIFRVSAAGYPR